MRVFPIGDLLANAIVSRHKAKTRDRRPAAAAPASPEEQARKALDAGRFREAVDAYKALLKGERRADWIDSLAAAYAGRASDLQAKGMFAEALAIWRNRASACGTPLTDPAYVECLCRAGDLPAALRALAATVDPAARGAIETRLVARTLVVPPEALSTLPEDDPLRRHHAAAQAALAACCAGDAEGLEAALRGIPHRSPYRDLRPTLKALDAAHRAPEQVSGLLARLAADSPFAKLAAVARAAVLPDDEWLPALAAADEATRRVLFELKGCPEATRPRLLELAQLGRTPAPDKVLDVFLHRPAPLPPAADRLCRRLLPHATRWAGRFAHQERRLSQFEIERIFALRCELDGHFGEARTHWSAAVDEIQKAGGDSRLAALILHKMALGGPNARAAALPAAPIAWLEESLRLDPDNREGRLKLIRFHIGADRMKAAREQLDTALASAPKDTETLLVAVETAIAGESYKKATAFAKQLLELDPINPQVRGLIGEAGLAQARKQIRAGRPDLAIKELDQAQPWLAEANSRHIAALLRALCAGDAAADALLREALAGLGGPLAGGFQLALEAQRTKLPAPKLFARAGLDLKTKPAASDVLSFVRTLDAADDNEKAIAGALDLLRQTIELAAASPLTAADRIAVCEALLRRREFRLLGTHARVALKLAPRQPLLVFFASFAAARGEPWELSDRELEKLDTARADAAKADDRRTTHRIGEFLAMEPEWDEEDDGDDRFGFDPAATEEKHIRMMVNLMIGVAGKKQFFEIVRENIGAARFNAFKAAAGKNEQRLIDLIVDYIAVNGGIDEFMFPGGGGGGEAKAIPQPKPNAKPAPEKKSTDRTSDRQKGLFDD